MTHTRKNAQKKNHQLNELNGPKCINSMTKEEMRNSNGGKSWWKTAIKVIDTGIEVTSGSNV